MFRATFAALLLTATLFATAAPAATRGAPQIYLPRNYASLPSAPLVLLLHGFTGNADFTNLYFGMKLRAEQRGFILVTPEGTKNSQGHQFWNATNKCCDLEHSGVDDVAIF